MKESLGSVCHANCEACLRKEWRIFFNVVSVYGCLLSLCVRVRWAAAGWGRGEGREGAIPQRLPPRAPLPPPADRPHKSSTYCKWCTFSVARKMSVATTVPNQKPQVQQPTGTYSSSST